MCPANIMAKDKSKNVLKMEYVSTPNVIWDQLKEKYNFTVDACASDKNHLLSKYWTKKNSALDKNWDNEIVYCHPMYDINIPKFIKKAIESKCITVFLLPASTNAEYFHKYLYKKDNVDIRFLPREKGGNGYKFFSDDNDDPKTGYLRPLMVVVIDNRENKV